MFATLLGALPAPPGPVRDRLRAVLELQAEAGLEPLTDGATWLGDDGSDEPAGDPVERWARAADAAGAAVKAALVGPWTRGMDDPGQRGALAAELRDVVIALADAGCPLVEVHESAAAIEVHDAAAFLDIQRRLTDGATNVHLSLALTGGDSDALGPALFDLAYASFGFDLRRGPENWRLIADAPGDRGIVVGALSVDEGSDDGPELLAWAVHYAAALGGRGLARVGLGTAGSLADLSWDVAAAKVRALGVAARIAAHESFEEMAPHLDPRAVGMKSAALGRFVPPRRDSR